MTCGEPATVSAAVEHWAWPEALTARLLQLAIAVPSALNVTLPSAFGLPAPRPVPVTVAVKVTDSPNVEGFGLELRAVEVVRLLTVCPPGSVPVLSAKLAPFRYSAVMTCGEPATVSAAVEHWAWPAALTATVLQLAIAVPSALNVTLPSALGLPTPSPVPVTVAVKVTDSPNVEGFLFELTAVDVVRLLTVCPPGSVPVLVTKLAAPL